MFGMGSRPLAVLAGTFLWLSPISTQAVDDNNDIVEDAMQVLAAGESQCIYDPATRVLSYVGETDSESVDCFLKHRDSDVRSLRVTSNVGLVKPAIEGAWIIHEEKWPVEASGLCASSCMNYWAPASASFSSTAGTRLIVHGKPPWRLISLFANDDYRRHQRFARELKIDDDWFGTTLAAGGTISRNIGNPDAPYLLVGPCHARLIADIVPINIWWPSSKGELRKLVEGAATDLRIKECELDGLAD